jgi:hypothetical protein
MLKKALLLSALAGLVIAAYSPSEGATPACDQQFMSCIANCNGNQSCIDVCVHIHRDCEAAT